MSPEQTLGTRAPDARTDVFSLGCVLYEMIVGEPPASWPAESPGARPRLTDVPAAHRQRLDEVPVAVEEVLVRALAWVPEERWASAAEFAAALGSIRHTARSPRRTSRKEELTPEAATRIRDHLGAWCECQACARFQKKYLSLVASTLERQRCPEEVRAKILSLLSLAAP